MGDASHQQVDAIISHSPITYHPPGYRWEEGLGDGWWISWCKHHSPSHTHLSIHYPHMHIDMRVWWDSHIERDIMLVPNIHSLNILSHHPLTSCTHAHVTPTCHHLMGDSLSASWYPLRPSYWCHLDSIPWCQYDGVIAIGYWEQALIHLSLSQHHLPIMSVHVLPHAYRYWDSDGIIW